MLNPRPATELDLTSLPALKNEDPINCFAAELSLPRNCCQTATTAMARQGRGQGESQLPVAGIRLGGQWPAI